MLMLTMLDDRDEQEDDGTNDNGEELMNLLEVHMWDDGHVTDCEESCDSSPH